MKANELANYLTKGLLIKLASDEFHISLKEALLPVAENLLKTNVTSKPREVNVKIKFKPKKRQFYTVVFDIASKLAPIQSIITGLNLENDPSQSDLFEEKDQTKKETETDKGFDDPDPQTQKRLAAVKK